MNKRRDDSRLYSAYVWHGYWNGVEFVYFIGFCDDTESVICDVCCRMSNSKPCLVSVEHSAAAEGCLLGRCLWGEVKTKRFVDVATDAGCPSNAGRFSPPFPVLYRSETVSNLRRLWMVFPIFLVYLGENVYYCFNVNNAHLVDSAHYHSYNKCVSTHLLHFQF